MSFQDKKHRYHADGERVQRSFKKCSDKNCYSKRQAERVALSVMRKRNRKVHAYECDVCHYWHLTSIEHYDFARINKNDRRSNKFQI